MDIDLIFKIVVAIVGIGICIKVFKFISSIIFKLALVAFVILLVYQLFL